MAGTTLKATLLMGLTAVWAVGSWWWYTCEIKGFCAGDTARESASITRAGASSPPSDPHGDDAVVEQVLTRLDAVEVAEPPPPPPPPLPDAAADVSAGLVASKDTLNRASADPENVASVETGPVSPAEETSAARQPVSDHSEAPVAAPALPAPEVKVETPPEEPPPAPSRAEIESSAPIASDPGEGAEKGASAFVLGNRLFSVVSPDPVPAGAFPQRVYLYFEQTVSGIVPEDVGSYLDSVARLVRNGGKRVTLFTPPVSRWGFGSASFANERRARYVRILLHRRGVSLAEIDLEARAGAFPAMVAGRRMGASFPTEPVELVVHD